MEWRTASVRNDAPPPTPPHSPSCPLAPLLRPQSMSATAWLPHYSAPLLPRWPLLHCPARHWPSHSWRLPSTAQLPLPNCPAALVSDVYCSTARLLHFVTFLAASQIPLPHRVTGSPSTLSNCTIASLPFCHCIIISLPTLPPCSLPNCLLKITAPIASMLPAFRSLPYCLRALLALASLVPASLLHCLTAPVPHFPCLPATLCQCLIS